MNFILKASDDELRNLIKSILSEELKNLNLKSTIQQNTYMNTTEVCKYLGIAKSTLSLWKRENKIQYSKLGKRVVFNKKLIDEMVQKNEIRAENV